MKAVTGWVERFFIGMNSRWKVVGFIILPVLLLSLFSNWSTYRGLTERALARRQALAQLAARVLEEKFEHANNLAVSLATRVRFVRLIEEGRWDEAAEILRDVPENFPFIERVFITDSAGTQMAARPHIADVIGKNFAYRDWYKGVSREWKPYVSEAYERMAEPRYQIVSVAVPIRSQGAGGVAGILVLQLRIDVFLEWGRGLSDSAATVYFADQSGNIVGHPSLSGRLSNHATAPFVRRVMQGSQGVEKVADPVSGEDVIAAFMPVAPFGWAALVSEPVGSVFAFRRQQMLNVFLLNLVLLVMSAALAGLVLSGMEAVRRASRQMAEASRLKSEFLANMSHELRTPLNGVIGFSEFLADGKPGPLNDWQKECVNDVLTSGRHLLQLINDVLDLSKIEAGKMDLNPEPFSVPKAVEEVCSNLSQVAARKRVDLRKEVASSLEEVTLDPYKFKQVLYNLLSNAVKFTNEGGTVELSVGRRNGHIEVRVRDSGIGIKKEDLAKLFVEFQQLDTGASRQHQGTGLGLALTKKIVELQNGTVGVESEFGRGSVFTVHLPLVA